MIRKTAMVILYLPRQKNTCSMSATKTLEITEDNSNENIFKKTTDKFYKEIVMKNLANSSENTSARVSFSVKLQA